MPNRQVTALPVQEKSVADGNWDTSRAPIDRVIIHTEVGTNASADQRFNNPTQQVSAHYGVGLDGAIWHWVDEDNTAYHAGDYAMNQRSIGIEHSDNGDYNGVRTDALYTTSANLVRDICKFYGIPMDRQHILKHSEVHATGCPDALDIDRIVREANGSAPAPQPTPNNGQLEVEYDNLVILFHQMGHPLFPTDHREDYVGKNKLVEATRGLFEETKRQSDTIGALKKITYSVWSLIGKNKWQNRLHELKAVFEK